ncbi:Os02g0106650 [Oryza sativa Japonica Group]|uniref:Os02g0106650 protein n=1 Tax=Oryza sativa subsp. japonica TaxID=39947 RepID=C7IZ29_ORYSJ|nr:Os02g0106650 [Oryza sativa Japonica Group]|eukprot:NP_001172769.1 Os02g0106650 [Oryza sativa Japonica Group]
MHASRRHRRGLGSGGAGRRRGRRAAGRARRAPASGEPSLDAARVEAVAAHRHDAHGVPVDELGEADGALRGAGQLGARRGVHQSRGRRRRVGLLHRRLLRVLGGGGGGGWLLPGPAVAAEQVPDGGVEREGEGERGEQGGEDDGHVAGEVAGAGVGTPSVGGDGAGRCRAVGRRAVGVVRLVLVLVVRRHRHGDGGVLE